jgi:hypothetical protein
MMPRRCYYCGRVLRVPAVHRPSCVLQSGVRPQSVAGTRWHVARAAGQQAWRMDSERKGSR